MTTPPKRPPTRTVNNQRRGAAYEREVAEAMARVLGRPVTRNLGQARDGGDDITVPPFRIECKRRRAFAVYEYIEQVVAALREPGEIPVVIMRGDGKDSLVLMRLEDWLPIFKREVF